MNKQRVKIHTRDGIKEAPALEVFERRGHKWAVTPRATWEGFDTESWGITHVRTGRRVGVTEGSDSAIEAKSLLDIWLEQTTDEELASMSRRERLIPEEKPCPHCNGIGKVSEVQHE